jgi:hypothetical protein
VIVDSLLQDHQFAMSIISAVMESYLEDVFISGYFETHSSVYVYGGKVWLAVKADNLTTVYEPVF